MGDERDGTEGFGHFVGRSGLVGGLPASEAAAVAVVVFLPGEAPTGVVGSRDRSTLHTGLGILRPEERVEVVVGSFERSGLFEAPMTTLLHGRAPHVTG